MFLPHYHPKAIVRCQSLLGGNGRFPLLVVDFGRYQPSEGERRSGRRKTWSSALLFARVICRSRLRVISSPCAGRRNVSPHREKERGDVNCLAFNPFNEWVVATGSADKTVKLFDLRKLENAVYTLDCHKQFKHGYHDGVEGEEKPTSKKKPKVFRGT
ncbi:hypothetical protein BHM03_00011161 [Ensete ventricosum]|uniref:Uncharacterized protein n=1 Tax=Ensete ventricosum TaxID=4639 RepID=A0A445MDA0_ENSVE|nr:hypothetical protein BHM03_00011161 [Ensete ventricosum]